jgi:hypothetical protein
MRSVLLSLVLIAAMAVSAFAQAQSKPGDVVLVGEIIDVKCYTTGMMGGRGPEHEDCAIACIKGGLPVGLLDEESGQVYTIVPAKGMKGANTALLPFVAKRVKIQGSLVEKGGNQILAYTSIEEAK